MGQLEFAGPLLDLTPYSPLMLCCQQCRAQLRSLIWRRRSFLKRQDRFIPPTGDICAIFFPSFGGGWGFSESVEILMENDYTMFFCYWEMLRIVGWMISTPRKNSPCCTCIIPTDKVPVFNLRISALTVL